MKPEASSSSANNVLRRASRRVFTAAAGFALTFLLAVPGSLAAQDWFRTGTGLGVSKPRAAVADFASRNPSSQSFATLFGDVVRNDLDYSGVVDIASRSFYPTQVPSVPSE